MRRDDRDHKTYFRSQRIFCTNGQWYFATREGERGPYGTRSRAEGALAMFVNEKVELDGFQRSRGKAGGRSHPEPAVTVACLNLDLEAPKRKALIY